MAYDPPPWLAGDGLGAEYQSRRKTDLFVDGDGLAPFLEDGIALIHIHSAVYAEHLRPFATSPFDIFQKMRFAERTRTGGSVDASGAILNKTTFVAHHKPLKS